MSRSQKLIVLSWPGGMIYAACILAIATVPLLHAQPAEAVVYLDSSRQVIRGFGAANIMPWRPDMTADNIQKAFGTGDGQLGFSLLRLRLPSTVAEFSLNLPTAQAAVGMGAKLIASPWSPPAGMKSNNNIVGGRLLDTAYASFAAHMKSFVDYMAANGAPIYAVSVQNEPDITVTYESCDWNAAEMVKFVKENGPAVGSKIMAPESFQFIRTMSDAILNDSAAAAQVPIICGHIYGAGLASYPLAESKGKELWMTEHLVTDTNWTAVLATGKEIHDCMQAGMNAYVWWYIVRYYGPIHENGYVTKRGFVMSQFSRFIRPGFRRVHTYLPRGAVPMTAYIKDSRTVIVAVNAGSAVDQTIRLDHIPIPIGPQSVIQVTPYVTSPTKNSVQGTPMNADPSFTVSFDSSSITTFVCDVITSTHEEPTIPRSVALLQNYPNPFNPSTLIRFELPSESQVSLKVFDLLGREVASLTEGVLQAGHHTTEWTASKSPSGVYVYRLAVKAISDDGTGFVESKSMILIR